ncbi:MAG: acyltransferase [Bacteroidales bacterium]|nr:acyltransferase [Bacteroidales bacterium]
MALEHENWKGTTGGMPWMQRTLIRLLAIVDQRIIYGVLCLVVPFYMLFNHKGYISMYHFFRDGFQESWWKAFAHVYANHFRFGQIIVDRFAAFGGRTFKFEFSEGKEKYQALAREDGGFVQLSSHMGNYELAGYILKQEIKKIYALVFWGETETVMENRRKMFSAKGVEMVPVKSDMSHIFELNNALRDGQIVSMPGDRIFGSVKSLKSSFMDHSVKLPFGPFQLALLREVPMVAIFVMKERWDTYKIYFRFLEADESLGKKEQAQQLADDFAREMESIVRLYPTQWFNYFEFWED